MSTNFPPARTGRIPAALSAVAAIALLAWLSCSDVWMPKGSSTISRWYADDVSKYCTNLPLGAVDGVWRPSAGLVREAEAGLSAHLAERQNSGLTMPHEAPVEQPFGYHHQYLGLVIDGERVLFINAYPFYDDEALNERAGLLERPECVADGGRYFWRVFYHPRSKTFSRFEFDGRG